ncbi:unnamed protein product [Urochloa decumbens]|uniref:F-box domain-containing protein n=1 Tax=Urochloa decumbens TaxID=240449 RepID=A0ABC9ELV3_9POAL
MSMMSNSEQHLQGAVAKRRKVPENLLCNLPTDILSTILSLLPINDAIRTSILSRKLKHVWCSHSNLTFDKGTMWTTYFRPSTGYYGVLRDKEFITMVDTVLHQHSGMGVEHMEIKFGLHKLTTVSLQLPSDFKGFMNLKSLTLVDVSITDEDVQCMLSKCNLLEFFEIAYCGMVTCIRMLRPLDRLKHLVSIFVKWMKCRHRPYCKEDGELRVGLPHQHNYLKSVRISGFFGHKDQVELALHILRSSIVLGKMEITPKLEISNYLAMQDCLYEQEHYVNGHRVATEFVCKADHRNVVNVVSVLPST